MARGFMDSFSHEERREIFALVKELHKEFAESRRELESMKNQWRELEEKRQKMEQERQESEAVIEAERTGAATSLRGAETAAEEEQVATVAEQASIAEEVLISVEAQKPNLEAAEVSPANLETATETDSAVVEATQKFILEVAEGNQETAEEWRKDSEFASMTEKNLTFETEIEGRYGGVSVAIATRNQTAIEGLQNCNLRGVKKEGFAVYPQIVDLGFFDGTRILKLGVERSRTQKFKNGSGFRRFSMSSKKTHRGRVARPLPPPQPPDRELLAKDSRSPAKPPNQGCTVARVLLEDEVIPLLLIDLLICDSLPQFAALGNRLTIARVKEIGESCVLFLICQTGLEAMITCWQEVKAHTILDFLCQIQLAGVVENLGIYVWLKSYLQWDPGVLMAKSLSYLLAAQGGNSKWVSLVRATCRGCPLQLLNEQMSQGHFRKWVLETQKAQENLDLVWMCRIQQAAGIAHESSNGRLYVEKSLEFYQDSDLTLSQVAIPNEFKFGEWKFIGTEINLLRWEHEQIWRFACWEVIKIWVWGNYFVPPFLTQGHSSSWSCQLNVSAELVAGFQRLRNHIRICFNCFGGWPNTSHMAELLQRRISYKLEWYSVPELLFHWQTSAWSCNPHVLADLVTGYQSSNSQISEFNVWVWRQETYWRHQHIGGSWTFTQFGSLGGGFIVGVDSLTGLLENLLAGYGFALNDAAILLPQPICINEIFCKLCWTLCFRLWDPGGSCDYCHFCIVSMLYFGWFIVLA